MSDSVNWKEAFKELRSLTEAVRKGPEIPGIEVDIDSIVQAYTSVDIAKEPVQTRILIIYGPTSEIVDIVTVPTPTPTDTKSWIEWLNEARETAESAGCYLYNWGNIETKSKSGIEKRLKEL